jgi:hypothetical protein
MAMLAHGEGSHDGYRGACNSANRGRMGVVTGQRRCCFHSFFRATSLSSRPRLLLAANGPSGRQAGTNSNIPQCTRAAKENGPLLLRQSNYFVFNCVAVKL